MKRVFIIEDQTILCDLLQETLATMADFDVIGSEANGLRACERCLADPPDVVVLDLMLPGMDGVDILYRLKHERPEIRVLVFSANFNPVLLRQVVEAGAEGFIEKTAGLDEFRRAIEDVSNGQDYFGSAVVDVLRRIMVQPASGGRGRGLTRREREILELVVESLTSQEIAERLGLSVKTVQNHRTSLMKKVGVHNVAGLLRYAMEAGLTRPPGS